MTSFDYHLRVSFIGGVSEWPMEHAWKACKRDKRFVGSNPTSSEIIDEPFSRFLGKGFFIMHRLEFLKF